MAENPNNNNDDERTTLTLTRDAANHLVITFSGADPEMRREQYVKKLAHNKVRYKRSGGGDGFVIKSAKVRDLREEADAYYIIVQTAREASRYLPDSTRTGRLVVHGQGEIRVPRTYTQDEWRKALGRWNIVWSSSRNAGNA